MRSSPDGRARRGVGAYLVVSPAALAPARVVVRCRLDCLCRGSGSLEPFWSQTGHIRAARPRHAAHGVGRVLRRRSGRWVCGILRRSDLDRVLFLGRRAATQFALFCIAAFAVQAVLDLTGIRFFPNRAPLLLEFIGQFGLLMILVALALLLARAQRVTLEHLRQGKSEAEQERAYAERAQARWALINTVALRIQESTTPQQVYRSIGEELEQLGLHCVLLEWAEPNVSMRIAYSSIAPELLPPLHEGLLPSTASLRFPLADQPNLRQVIQERAPVLLRDPISAAKASLPEVPAPVLTQLIQQLDLRRVVFAPMIVGEGVSGVLGVFGKNLDEEDLAPFAALAHHTASALEKARLLTAERRRTAQLELVSSITARVNSAENAEQMIEPLVQTVGERFGYEVVSVMLMDERRSELYVAATYSKLSNEHSRSIRLSVSRGIMGLVTRTGMCTSPAMFQATRTCSRIRRAIRFVPDSSCRCTHRIASSGSSI